MPLLARILWKSVILVTLAGATGGLSVSSVGGLLWLNVSRTMPARIASRREIGAFGLAGSMVARSLFVGLERLYKTVFIVSIKIGVWECNGAQSARVINVIYGNYWLGRGGF